MKQSLKTLLEIKFPVIISVQAQCATYKHEVVIWRKMVIDYESKYIYPLTEDSLRQVCGLTITFQCITSWYGFVLSRHIHQSQRMCISKIGIHQNIMNQRVLLENISSKQIFG